jgi:predicted molibdopterin-dependent oxidoreductase YjgC
VERPESALEAWKQCSAGRPCDYTAITYDRLRGGSGIQWPCTEAEPDGVERLYADGRFNTDPDYCETYGQDLDTGAESIATEYRSKQPEGWAFLHPLDYEPSSEVPDEEFPLLLTTGRTVYQFHTRTKTGRAQQLNDAAPQVWVEVSPDDARGLQLAEGDLVRVESARGTIRARVRVCGVRPGVVFVPFHYGYWDTSQDGSEPRRERAANELTVTAWDPVSKQPIFKVAAGRLVKTADAGDEWAPAPTVGASAPLDPRVPATVGGPTAECSSTLLEE